jgi:hypothetical protein
MSWNRAEFYALAARLNANGIDEARPPNDDEAAGAYLPKLYGWVMDACTRAPVPAPAKAADGEDAWAKTIMDELTKPKGGRIRIQLHDHLIDHDAEALLQGKNLDPELRGVEFTYKRGSF